MRKDAVLCPNGAPMYRRAPRRQLCSAATVALCVALAFVSSRKAEAPVA